MEQTAKGTIRGDALKLTHAASYPTCQFLADLQELTSRARAVGLLAAEGERITHVALEAGYSTPSAFIAMFRRVLGTTPRRYFQNSLSGKG